MEVSDDQKFPLRMKQDGSGVVSCPLALSVARLGTYMDHQWVMRKTKRNRPYLRPLTSLSLTNLIDQTPLAYLSPASASGFTCT